MGEGSGTSRKRCRRGREERTAGIPGQDDMKDLAERTGYYGGTRTTGRLKMDKTELTVRKYYTFYKKAGRED